MAFQDINSLSGYDIKSILEKEEKLKIEKSLALQKAMNSGNVNEIYSAQKVLNTIQKRDEVDTRAMLIDPLDLSTSFGYKDKPYNISYEVLRAMANTHIIKAIRQTRKSQTLTFCEPQKDKYSTGFIIDKRGKWRSTERDKKLTSEEQKRVDELTQMILDCGTTENYWHGDNFSTFIGKLVDDSLVLDQATAEIIRNRRGIPIEWLATDAATFRLSESYGDDDNIKNAQMIKGYTPSYVQLYQGKVVADFYPWDLMWGVRNPSTNIRTTGYGESELEIMMQTITALLNADFYNANFFKVGSAPKGILSYSGNINQNTLEDFRKQWMAQVAGVMNMHKIPLINADKINFIPTHVPNKDMEFSKFQEFLIKVACAVYTIDPAEIGFPMSGASDAKPVFEGSNEARLQYSKDKGLKPLLKHLQTWINKYIIWPIDPRFEFRFVGIDSEEDKVAELDMDIKKVNNFMTLNEIREKYNLEPIDDGDVVLNPIFMQNQQKAMIGDPNSNQAVNEMNPNDDPDNPFLKSLNNDIQQLFATV